MDFYVDPRSVLMFLHIVCFGYWLGADLGVYFCDSQLIRDDLSLDERLRVRKIRYKLDMLPRTCLILIMALGFSLALPYQSPVTGPWLWVLWVAAFVWLGVVWRIYFTAGTPEGDRLAQWDIRWRYLMTVSFIGFGLYCLINGGPIADKWLSFKLLLFGIIILNGVWIRKVAARWQPIFDLVRAGGEDRIKGEVMMKINRIGAGRANMTIWTLVAIMALIGKAKPF